MPGRGAAGNRASHPPSSRLGTLSSQVVGSEVKLDDQIPDHEGWILGISTVRRAGKGADLGLGDVSFQDIRTPFHGCNMWIRTDARDRI